MTGPPSRRIAYYGANHEGFDAPEGHRVPVGTWWTDIWGTGRHKEHEGVMGFPKIAPLDTPSRLGDYRWPDPQDERICGRIYEQAGEEHDADTVLAGTHRDTLWENAYMLVGMEAMMEYFYTEPSFAREVLHGIMDFQLGIATHYLDLGVELVGLGDDMGTRSGPLLGPQIVAEFLVPEYRRIFELYRENGVLISFHSCGAVEWMLDTFLDLGVDILNPVQATANDLDAVRARTQGRMALMGGVESHVIASGPPEAIEEKVRYRMWQLGRAGGYFCRPDQHMPWPPEHYNALVRAVEEHGRYPLAPAE